MKKTIFLARITRLGTGAVVIFFLLAAIIWYHRTTLADGDRVPSEKASVSTARHSTGGSDESVARVDSRLATKAGDAESRDLPTSPNDGGITSNHWVAHQKEQPSTPVAEDFLTRILSPDEKLATIPLPGGGTAVGRVTLVQRDGDGLLLVQGDVTAPEAGKFMFQRQTEPGVAGPLVGHVHYDKSDVAYQIRPVGKNGGPMLVKVSVDEVICRVLPVFVGEASDPEETPQTHPTDYPIPPDENGIIQLQSLPGATAVVYLDFDGEEENFPSWGYINAKPSGRSASQIFDVWRGIAEDYQPFNINITTVRSVYDAATQGRRMHVIFTPTTDASPGSGGVAYVGSFNQSGHRVCWVFYTSGKNAVEAGSHEIGHTLGLSHDGRITPAEDYYKGHNGWAPIMGVGYYHTLSQWSKGEYPSANRTEDDLLKISSNNNSVAYRTDDCGGTFATSAWLDIKPGGAVSNEGIIETTGDQDGFRFSTSGGAISLTIKNVSFNPNLDIIAEVLTASGAVISSSDPDASTSASFSSLELAAGDYFLRVSGTGKGESDLSTGYTNYGSLGAYIIAGTIAGGEAADHFSIAENTASGSSVGVTASRLDHGAGTLAFAIASGNMGGTFNINSSTGEITVANSSKLDFETLSTRWDDPATFELFVSITDSLGVATESIRTVVTLGDVNEVPVLTMLSPLTLPENLPLGTVIATASAVDPDRSDYVNYSIVSGNTDNAFAINPATGVITVAGELDFETTANYPLVIRAADHGTPATQVDTPFTISILDIPEGLFPGSVVRAIYKNISGNSLGNLTSNSRFPGSPDSFETLSSFDGGANLDDNFGSTICGYLIPPVTGNYTFWIASDDASELRISSGANPANAVVRASLSSSTSRYNWTSKSSQKSIAIALVAGQACYIEARHKEGTGSDHVAVAWQGPGMSAKEVIPGRWLAPFPTNYAPVIESAVYSIRENASPGRAFGSVSSNDLNVMDSIGEYTITAGNAGGAFAIDPATGQLTVALPEMLHAAITPVYTLTIQATDNGIPPFTGTGTVTVNVIAADDIKISGIVQEIWTGLSSSTAVSSLTESSNFPNNPNRRRTLTNFDSGADIGDNYGSRIRARFFPPTSGVYHFYINSDEDSRLLFSEDPSGAGAAEIASVTGSCNPNEWTKFPSQESAEFTLVAGQAVYLETLHKEATGSDHVSVGYTGPDAGAVTLISESLLRPFDINAPPVFSPASYSYSASISTATPGLVLGFVNASDPNEESLVYSILSGNTEGAFEIEPATGKLSITDPALLVAGAATLQVIAQDRGLDGVYPLASAVATVEIQVLGVNSPPAFLANPTLKPTAFADVAYLETLAGSATDADAGDTLSYSKISGPAWLIVDSNGKLSGTPSEVDRGINSFVVRVSDMQGAFDEATLVIKVPGIATWVNTTGGTWQEPGNWQDGVICGGTGSTADFSTLDLTEEAIVTLEETRYVGNLVFGDTTPSNDWLLGSGTQASVILGVTQGTPTITVNNRSATIDLVLAGAKGLVKEGAGTLILSGSNTYTGNTMVTNGELRINGSVASENVSLGTDATLSGSGNVTGAISVSGRIDAGDGVGMLVTGPITLEESAMISWQVSDWSGESGVGYDQLKATSLDLAAVTGVSLILQQKNIANFTDIAKTFTLVETTGGITGFAPEKFNIDATDLPTATGIWEMRVNGNDLVIDYTPLNSAPVFTVNPIDGGKVAAAEPFSFSIESLATDADPGDSLSYTKISGPDWLQIASNGELSGTPPITSIGINSFTVTVTDSGLLSDTTDLVVEVTGTPWQNWQFASFGANAILPLTAGELDDPDHDGIANLLEYALALNPNSPDTTASVLTHDIETSDGKEYLRLSVSRSTTATDVWLKVEVSGDMSTWTTDQTLIETDNENTLQVRDTVPMDAEECRFIRLKAESPPSIHSIPAP